MLLMKNKIYKTNEYCLYEKNDYKVYYKGIFFLRGYRAGIESIRKMLELYMQTGKFEYEKYYGTFSVVVETDSNEYICFSDNSRMSCFFYSSTAISDNFLKLLRAEPRHKEWDQEAMEMFWQLGGIYFDKTLIKGISVLNSKNYLQIKDGVVTLLTKNVGDIDGKSDITNVYDFFKDVGYALSEYKVASALTGGYDSRMVTILLNQYLPLDIFFSGENEDQKDLIYARKAATALGKKLELVSMNNEISDQWIIDSFDYFQGMYPTSHYMFHNIMEFNNDRIKKGYQVALNGDGGVLHKDWEWMQDFPFYNKKHINFKKLYKQRVKLLDFSEYLGAQILKNKDFDNMMIDKLKGCQKKTNSQTYDSYYFNIYLAKNTPYANSNIISYGPLMELQLVRYAYHLPRKERYFCNYMRKIMTKTNIKAARVPTVYGPTASSKKSDLFFDFWKQMIQYGEKAVRYFKRRVLNVNNVKEDLSSVNVNSRIRAMDISKKAVSYCVECDYLKPGSDIETIPFQMLDRSINVYLLHRYMEAILKS